MPGRKTYTMRTVELKLEEESLMPYEYHDERHMCMLVAKILKCTSGNDGATAPPPPRHRGADSSTAWRRLINDRSRAREIRETLGEDHPLEEDLVEWNIASCDANVLLQVAAGYACNGQGILLLDVIEQEPAERQTVGARETLVTFKPCNEESIASLIYLLYYWETTTVGANPENGNKLTDLTNWLCTQPGIQRDAVDRMLADVAGVEASDCILNNYTRGVVMGSLLSHSSSGILKFEELLNSSPKNTCCKRQERPNIEIRVMNMDTGRMEMYSGGNYVCLSYVWQQWNDEQLREQLMLCHRSLPYRRIWCDRWSIRQSDAADIGFWVSKMDAIYECARQVVVLVGEHGGECTSRPTPQAIHTRDEIEKWSPALAAWAESQWHTRVWTMQEAMLAADAQVFFRGEAKGWSVLELAAASSIKNAWGRTYCDNAYRVRAVGESVVLDSLTEFGRILKRCDECDVSADTEGVKMPLGMLIGLAMKRKCQFPGDMVNGVAALANIKVPIMPKDWDLNKCLKALLEGGRIGAECMALGAGNEEKNQYYWLAAKRNIARYRHFPDTIAAHSEGGLLSVRATLATCKRVMGCFVANDAGRYTYRAVEFECNACGATLNGETDDNWKGSPRKAYDLILNKTEGLVVTTLKNQDGTARVTDCRSVKLVKCEACKCTEDRLYTLAWLSNDHL